MELQLEEKYKKIVPDWIERLHEHYVEGKELDEDYAAKIRSLYSNCFVGDLRSKLGLGIAYSNTHFKSFCNECTTLADLMRDMSSRGEYIANLASIKQHMEKEHGVKI